MVWRRFQMHWDEKCIPGGWEWVYWNQVNFKHCGCLSCTKETCVHNYKPYRLSLYFCFTDLHGLNQADGWWADIFKAHSTCLLHSQCMKTMELGLAKMFFLLMLPTFCGDEASSFIIRRRRRWRPREPPPKPCIVSGRNVVLFLVVYTLRTEALRSFDSSKKMKGLDLLEG